ncbi:MAG: amidase [Solirubrobacteraceae bacterium]|nr:amidase [Solirubrobacteraceae bacterium]
MGTVDPDLLRRSAVDLAALVRSGEVAAVDLVRAALDRVAAVDDGLGAFVDTWADEALEQAAAVGPGDPRPFAGVPTAVKDNRAVAGHRTGHGSAFTAGLVAEQDDEVVARLRRAGFVLVGATKLPEWAITPVTRSRAFGVTRNPWDPGRTAGGSSGGAAAAVAAGMVPVAHGNDGGGSIRIPAACCGLVGLKPQRGRISMAPGLGHHLLATDGMLVRTVADAAATLDVIAGPAVGDATWAPPPAEPFAAAAVRGGGGGAPRRRVAVTTEPVLEGAPSPEDVAAVRRTADLLSDLGHEVEEVTPPWAGAGLLDLFTDYWAVMIGVQIRALEWQVGRPAGPGDLEALSVALADRARGIGAVDHLVLDARIQAVGRQVVGWQCGADGRRGWDVILTPTLGTAPVPVDALDPDGPDPMDGFRRGAHFSPYAAIANVIGSPAISLPLWVRGGDDDAAGLPVGVQLVGPPAGEDVLLELAAELEVARPWADRTPAPAVG